MVNGLFASSVTFVKHHCHWIIFNLYHCNWIIFSTCALWWSCGKWSIYFTSYFRQTSLSLDNFQLEHFDDLVVNCLFTSHLTFVKHYCHWIIFSTWALWWSCGKWSICFTSHFRQTSLPLDNYQLEHYDDLVVNGLFVSHLTFVKHHCHWIIFSTWVFWWSCGKWSICFTSYFRQTSLSLDNFFNLSILIISW